MEWGGGYHWSSENVCQPPGLTASTLSAIHFPPLGSLLFLVLHHPKCVSASKVFRTMHVTISDFSLELWFLFIPSDGISSYLSAPQCLISISKPPSPNSVHVLSPLPGLFTWVHNTSHLLRLEKKKKPTDHFWLIVPYFPVTHNFVSCSETSFSNYKLFCYLSLFPTIY